MDHSKQSSFSIRNFRLKHHQLHLLNLWVHVEHAVSLHLMKINPWIINSMWILHQEAHRISSDYEGQVYRALLVSIQILKFHLKKRIRTLNVASLFFFIAFCSKRFSRLNLISFGPWLNFCSKIFDVLLTKVEFILRLFLSLYWIIKTLRFRASFFKSTNLLLLSFLIYRFVTHHLRRRFSLFGWFLFFIRWKYTFLYFFSTFACCWHGFSSLCLRVSSTEWVLRCFCSISSHSFIDSLIVFLLFFLLLLFILLLVLSFMREQCIYSVSNIWVLRFEPVCSVFRAGLHFLNGAEDMYLTLWHIDYFYVLGPKTKKLEHVFKSLLKNT